MDQLNDRELRGLLFEGCLDPRKRAFARELLRRRYAEKGKGALWRLSLPVLDRAGTVRAAVRRIWRPAPKKAGGS